MQIRVPMIIKPISVLLTVLLAVGASMATAETVDFSLPDRTGKIHTLSDYRGKWVLVNYWATWCPPCRKEMPELEAFAIARDGQAVVLGVNMEDVDDESLREFVEAFDISFPILLAGSRPDDDQTVGPIPGLPTSYLISPEGKVMARQVGPVTAEGIGAFIDQNTGE